MVEQDDISAVSAFSPSPGHGVLGVAPNFDECAGYSKDLEKIWSGELLTLLEHMQVGSMFTSGRYGRAFHLGKWYLQGQQGPIDGALFSPTCARVTAAAALEEGNTPYTTSTSSQSRATCAACRAFWHSHRNARKRASIAQAQIETLDSVEFLEHPPGAYYVTNRLAQLNRETLLLLCNNLRRFTYGVFQSAEQEVVHGGEEGTPVNEPAVSYTDSGEDLMAVEPAGVSPLPVNPPRSQVAVAKQNDPLVRRTTGRIPFLQVGDKATIKLNSWIGPQLVPPTLQVALQKQRLIDMDKPALPVSKVDFSKLVAIMDTNSGRSTVIQPVPPVTISSQRAHAPFDFRSKALFPLAKSFAGMPKSSGAVDMTVKDILKLQAQWLRAAQEGSDGIERWRNQPEHDTRARDQAAESTACSMPAVLVRLPTTISEIGGFCGRVAAHVRELLNVTKTNDPTTASVDQNFRTTTKVFDMLARLSQVLAGKRANCPLSPILWEDSVQFYCSDGNGAWARLLKFLFPGLVPSVGSLRERKAKLSNFLDRPVRYEDMCDYTLQMMKLGAKLICQDRELRRIAPVAAAQSLPRITMRLVRSLFDVHASFDGTHAEPDVNFNQFTKQVVGLVSDTNLTDVYKQAVRTTDMKTRFENLIGTSRDIQIIQSIFEGSALRALVYTATSRNATAAHIATMIRETGQCLSICGINRWTLTSDSAANQVLAEERINTMPAHRLQVSDPQVNVKSPNPLYSRYPDYKSYYLLGASHCKKSVRNKFFRGMRMLVKGPLAEGEEEPLELYRRLLENRGLKDKTRNIVSLDEEDGMAVDDKDGDGVAGAGGATEAPTQDVGGGGRAPEDAERAAALVVTVDAAQVGLPDTYYVVPVDWDLHIVDPFTIYCKEVGFHGPQAGLTEKWYEVLKAGNNGKMNVAAAAEFDCEKLAIVHREELVWLRALLSIAGDQRGGRLVALKLDEEQVRGAIHALEAIANHRHMMNLWWDAVNSRDKVEEDKFGTRGKKRVYKRAALNDAETWTKILAPARYWANQKQIIEYDGRISMQRESMPEQTLHTLYNLSFGMVDFARTYGAYRWSDVMLRYISDDPPEIFFSEEKNSMTKPHTVRKFKAREASIALKWATSNKLYVERGLQDMETNESVARKGNTAGRDMDVAARGGGGMGHGAEVEPADPGHAGGRGLQE